MTRRRWLWTTAAAAVGLPFAAAGGWYAWQRQDAAAADRQTVELLLQQSWPGPDGRPLPLETLRGTVLVVNFWATWCAPCVDEMPELSQLRSELHGRGVEVVGIGIDSAANISKFAERHPVSYPLLVAGGGGSELARQLGNPGGFLPYTVLIARDGRIAGRILGRVKIARLESQVTALSAR